MTFYLFVVLFAFRGVSGTDVNETNYKIYDLISGTR